MNQCKAIVLNRFWLLRLDAKHIGTNLRVK